MIFKDELNATGALVETALENYFQPYNNKLIDAMRYSLLAGGKRIRPVLLLKFSEACGGIPTDALSAACGIEMLHTYSLIHDDLPCMDNDDLRRGKPTCHVRYGYSMALLAGDALQAEAFKAVLKCPLSPDRVQKMAYILADSVGEAGMCGGQYLDIQNENIKDIEALKQLHSMKTGALLRAACVMGVYSAGGSEEQVLAASNYADCIGIAFQIKDDILDVISTTEELGKPVGSDDKNEKITYPVLLGIDRCEELVIKYTSLAKLSLKNCFKDDAFLIQFADYLCTRKK